MKLKEISAWYKEIKRDYDKNENSTEMDEGDFNVLEAEYFMLRAILRYDK